MCLGTAQHGPGSCTHVSRRSVLPDDGCMYCRRICRVWSDAQAQLEVMTKCWNYSNERNKEEVGRVAAVLQQQQAVTVTQQQQAQHASNLMNAQVAGEPIPGSVVTAQTDLRAQQAACRPGLQQAAKTTLPQHMHSVDQHAAARQQCNQSHQHGPLPSLTQAKQQQQQTVANIMSMLQQFGKYTQDTSRS